MRLASFHHAGRERYGVVLDDDRVAPCVGEWPDLAAAIAAGGLDRLQLEESLPLAEVTLRPVVPNPGKVFCVGHNYEEHRLETGRERVGHPSIFTRFADTLVAHGAPIVRPRASEQLDYEGEVAIVIGRGGRAIAEADAMSHVAGFTIANDASVRDWQKHTAQFTPGKNFPGTGALGPWLVTPDEVGSLDAMELTTLVNGRIMQQATLAQLIFPLATVIAYISAFTPLSPGDVIMTGTPGGVGARRDPPLWLAAGDRIEISVSRLGTLTNTVVDEGDPVGA
ncbi:fumarylacetoacetate hydrolase family protein [Sphingomonas sp.]|uniref:fumarylacetoacetate hydrolase family protein n=1 Tax=Sphingomonas sp. TaxID=28214 RepID=UPI002D7F5C1F|nr:fumarylacetoacetate hydrolase family protein [Sphingomonas sp.]HEU0045402.1 fumarylacetoacetate hydrolase family protein [Sphingomonas sp.]